MTKTNEDAAAVGRAMWRFRRAAVLVALFSAAVNLLMLTGPIFMLQIYDRVLTSGSVPTLVALFGLVAALFAMMGLFDLVRTRILSRVGHGIDETLAPVAFRTWLARSLGGHAPGYKPVQDLTTLRGFIASPTMLALFDLPWFPIYLGVVFMLHVQLGLLALAGAAVVLVLALLNEWTTARAAAAGARGEVAEARFAEQAQLGADGILAMGMADKAETAWRGLRHRALTDGQRAAERSEFFTAASKAFRLLLQSAILGLGAWLAIGQEITPGMIVAASIIAGRALAPIDQTIGGWRMIKRARIARQRLSDYLSALETAAPSPIQLPQPTGRVEARGVTKLAPGSERTGEGRAILSDISFSLDPGEGVGVIGPSASGKTSLAKLLTGLWLPDKGALRVDGATFQQWDPAQIGPALGYLPQRVSLLSGSIAQNIARFDPDASNEEIVEAAQMAGVHRMILGLPDGYATNVDAALSPLTGGQVQRIALARALFRRPRLVVMDEPNSNLDAEGDVALANAIQALREDGATVVVMAHRPSAIAAVDKVMVLHAGRIEEFGEKAAVLRSQTRAA